MLKYVINVPMQGHVQVMYSVYFTESIIILYILCNMGSNYTIIVHSSHAHIHFNCTYAIFNQYWAFLSLNIKLKSTNFELPPLRYFSFILKVSLVFPMTQTFPLYRSLLMLNLWKPASKVMKNHHPKRHFMKWAFRYLKTLQFFL